MPPHPDLDIHGLPAGPADAAPAQRDGIGPARNRPAAPAPARAAGTLLRYAATAVVLLALIVFVAQNTARAPIAFLGLDGSLPIAAALLAAAFAGAALTLAVGTARTARSRRRARRP